MYTHAYFPHRSRIVLLLLLFDKPSVSQKEKKITKNDDDVNVLRDGAFDDDKYNFKQLTPSTYV